MNKTMVLLCWMTVAVAPATGCKRSETPTAATPASARPALSAGMSTSIETSLADYESLRAALATDRWSETGAIAGRLEASANAAKEGASARITTQLDAMSTGAARLKPGGSVDDQRRIFGDISRAVVLLLSENTLLAKGRHVFQCPMAKGYQKWVQTSAQIENPYMGSRMPRCGSASEWRP